MENQSKSSKKSDFSVVENKDGTFNLLNIPRRFLEPLKKMLDEDTKKLSIKEEILDELLLAIRAKKLKNLDVNPI